MIEGEYLFRLSESRVDVSYHIVMIPFTQTRIQRFQDFTVIFVYATNTDRKHSTTKPLKTRPLSGTESCRKIGSFCFTRMTSLSQCLIFKLVHASLPKIGILWIHGHPVRKKAQSNLHGSKLNALHISHLSR